MDRSERDSRSEFCVAGLEEKDRRIVHSAKRQGKGVYEMVIRVKRSRYVQGSIVLQDGKGQTIAVLTRAQTKSLIKVLIAATR